MRDKGNIFMKGTVILLSALLFQGAAWAGAEELTVMTRNLYLGADLTPAMTAQDEDEFVAAVYDILGVIAYNNFPERAAALAAEIVEKKPHLVGLQEVYNFTINGSNGSPPFRDHLKDLLDALAAQGADYEVAAVVKNLDLALPFGGNSIGVVDRDVILARGDVATEVINPGTCRASVDGCNYNVVASASTPVGTIAIERGFVAVEAEWTTDNWITFVNTHFEVRDLDPTNPASQFFQFAQAAELLSRLAGMNGPVIVVGDFNSSPEDPVVDLGSFQIVPPYMLMIGAGYVDAWTLRPGDPMGLTCCQDEDLLNEASVLYERVDLIFASEEPEAVKVNVLGNDEADKTTLSGLWPSDHAGVAARMQFAP